MYFAERKFFNEKLPEPTSDFDSETEKCDDVIISIMKNIPSTDFTYYEFFEKNGYDLIDNLLYFFNMKDTSKYYLSCLFEPDEDFYVREVSLSPRGLLRF